ncbi:MAG TPA: BlaI/MecI/CopY family transcriptional regulator [Gemmatimonadales bacterium]
MTPFPVTERLNQEGDHPVVRDTKPPLSRREREIMDVIYRFGRATAQEVRDNLPEPPSYSAVRTLLRVLEDKGHVRHKQDGPRYLYLPIVPREKARESALKQVVRTFFNDSAEQAVAALLDLSAHDLTGEELTRLADMIERAKKEGR